MHAKTPTHCFMHSTHYIPACVKPTTPSEDGEPPFKITSPRLACAIYDGRQIERMAMTIDIKSSENTVGNSLIQKRSVTNELSEFLHSFGAVHY